MELFVNDALEEIVADEPYDDDGWSVLEDWLLEQEDPRAEILRSAEPETARAALFPLLLGDGHAELAAGRGNLHWRGGYVTEAMLFVANCQRQFELLLRAPAVTLLRSLSLGTGLPQLRATFPSLAAVPFARSLRLLQLTSDESVTLDATVLGGLRRLDTLILERVMLDPTDAPVFSRIATLSIAPGARPEKDLVPFLSRPFPTLRTLRLDFRHLDAGLRVPIDELAPLWNGTITPGLEYLITRDKEPVTAKALLGVLAGSALLPRLKGLKLGDHICDPKALLGFGDVFHHLEQLALPDDPRRFHNQPF